MATILTQEEHDTLRSALEYGRRLIGRVPENRQAAYAQFDKALSILEGVRGREGEQSGGDGDVPKTEPALSGSALRSGPEDGTPPTIAIATHAPTFSADEATDIAVAAFQEFDRIEWRSPPISYIEELRKVVRAKFSRR